MRQPKLIDMHLTPLRTLRFIASQKRLSRHFAAATACILIAGAMPVVNAGSLFGDPACETWPSTDIEVRRRWTLAFLAPLSMAHEDRQKTGEDKFNSKAEAAERAMTSIDSFCAANPGKTAADGAAAHLQSLVGTR
jgi:hypothetical protein